VQARKPKSWLWSATRVALRPWRDWLFLSALIAAVFVAYHPAWHGGLLWDDDAHVTRPELRSLDGLRRIWFELGATQQYYPLLHSFFWLQYQLWGEDTLGYHLTNLALHAAAAVLVVILLRRLAVPGTLLAAAIFALHPLQVESVAWITEQKNTLSTVFYLAAALLYLRFDQTRSKVLYGTALALFILGLLSKTVTATLPAALLVVFWWQRGRLSWKRDVLPLLPFFLLGIAAGVLTSRVEATAVGAEGAEYQFSVIERLLIAGRVIWFYLGKLLWPAELIFIYPRWTVSQRVWCQYLFPLAAMLLLLVLWGIRGRTRGPLAALLFFAGTLFPVLGFFNVYPFRYSLVADHFQYLAGLGIITLLSAGATLLGRRWQPRVRLVGQGLCLALLLVLASLSYQQSKIYTDAETLYTATIQRNPACWMACQNLGLTLYKAGHTREAIEHYHEALRLKPDLFEAHNDLGNALVAEGNLVEAVGHFERALRLKPDDADAHSNFGIALSALGRTEEAIQHYHEALRLRPGVEIYNNLATTLSRAGRTAEAIEQFQRALRLKPDYAEVHNNLGLALAQSGKFQEAIDHWQQAARLKPGYASPHNSLGVVLAQMGRTDEAIEHYHEALRLKRDFADPHHNLAVVLAAMGKTREAIDHFREALRLRPHYVEAHYSLALALCNADKTGEAIEHFREVVRARPDDAAARFQLAGALVRTERTNEALEHYRRALELTPDDVDVLNDLAWLLATHELADGGDPGRVVQLAQRARELAGQNNAQCLDTLAAAYAAAGRFDDAILIAQVAVQLAESSAQMALAQRIQLRLELYRAGRPYRESLNSPAQPKP